MSALTLDVLEWLCEHAMVEFDPELARAAVRQADLDLPGPDLANWVPRLEQAGKDVGLRITTIERSIREVMPLVASGEVLLTYAPQGPDGSHWLSVTGKGLAGIRVIDPQTEKASSLSSGELARRLGISGPQATARWVVAAPLAPGTDAVMLARIHRLHGFGHGGHDDHEESVHHRNENWDGSHGEPPLSRLLAFLRADYLDVRVIVLFAVAVGILSLITPLAVESLVMTVGFRMLLQQVVVLAILMFAFLSLSAAMFTVQKVVVEYIQRRLFVRMVADFAYRMPRIRLDALPRGTGSEMVNRFFDVATMQKTLAVLLIDGVALVLTTIIGLTVMAFYHPYLLGFDILLIASIVFFIVLLGRNGIRTGIEESMAKYDVAAWIEELARNPIAFKLSEAPEYAMERADAAAKKWLLARKDHFRVVYRQVIFAVTLQVIASTVLLGLGGWLVIQGQLTLGQLVASELIVAVIVGSFAKIGKFAESYYDLLAAVDEIGMVIDLPMEREGGEIHQGDERGAALLLRDVSFSFDEHHHVLSGLDHDIKPGERVAICGACGTGKSTLLELVLDLRSPTRGQIEFDGMDLRDIRLDALRDQVALVRDLDVIEGTIIDNVRMGRVWLTLSEVRSVLERVGLWREVSDMPAEMYRKLSSGGAPLSEGQVRKLLLARAIAGSPRLLVVDETLDMLEPPDRQHVVEMLFAHSAPWTLLVATHAPEVIERCDRVIELSSRHDNNGSNNHASVINDRLTSAGRD